MKKKKRKMCDLKQATRVVVGGEGGNII